MFVVFHDVRSCDAFSRLSARSAAELQRRIQSDRSFSLGFIAVAAGLGLGGIVRWACSLGLSDEVRWFIFHFDLHFQWVFEAARWGALCGQLHCLNVVVALTPRVLILETSESDTSKCQLAHFAAKCGHLHILQFLASANLEGLHYRNGVSTFFLLFYLLQSGKVPAHFACKEGHVDCLEFLARVCPQSIADRDFVRFSQQIIDLNLDWPHTSIFCMLCRSC